MTFTVTGHFTPDGRIELDERAPFTPSGPVRITVEPPSDRGSAIALPDEEELRRRMAAIRGVVGSISDEDADTMIHAVEEEFERADPDEWR